MRALALVAAGDARVIEIDEPRYAPGELLLQVKMVGLCGTDLNSYRGRNPMVTFPRVLGHEIGALIQQGSGTLSAGTAVTVSPYTHCGHCASCRRGRPNACQFNQTLGVQRDGAMTSRIVVPEGKVYPSTLTLRELCLVEPLTVGFHAVARGCVSANDTVAVLGCGGIGLGAIAGAAYRGARVIAIDMAEDKLAIATAAGATDAVDSSRENLHQRLLELTGGHGPDVIIEAIGSPETFRTAVEEVAFTGRVVYIGYAKELVSYETKLFVQKEINIFGSRNALPEDFHAVMKMLLEQRFPVDRMISVVVPLEEAPAILAEWAASPTLFTKILVEL